MLGEKEDARATLTLAIDEALSDKLKNTNILYHQPLAMRLLDAASTHILLLSYAETSDCSVIAPHFDGALSLVVQASHINRPFDLSFQSSIIQLRTNIDYMQNVRAACGPLPATPPK